MQHHYAEAVDHTYAWVPVLAICLGLFLSNMGWFSVTGAVVGELLPENTHNMANKVVVTFTYATAFVATKTFADLMEGLAPHGAFFLYGCVCIFGAIFTCIFIPETKSRTHRSPNNANLDPAFDRELQPYSSVPNQA